MPWALIAPSYEEFMSWGWKVLLSPVRLRSAISWRRSHDSETRRLLEQLDDVPVDLAFAGDDRLVGTVEPTETNVPTAIICVTSFSGFGRHLIAAVCGLFPRYFTNYIFVSAGLPGSRLLERKEDLRGLRETTERDLRKYVAWARTHGLRAGHRSATGAELFRALDELCWELVLEYPQAIVFIGKPIFRKREYSGSFYCRMATTLESRLRFHDIPTIVMPITVPHG